MTIIGLDIGGTNLRIGTVRGRELSDFRVVPSAVLKCGDPLGRLEDVIADYLAGADRPDAISMGMPISMMPDRKSVFCAPNLKKPDGTPCFDGVNVTDPLTERFGCPVFLDRDVNHLLYCDLVRMDLLDRGAVAAGYIGTGYGGALYIRGGLHYGLHSAAMDIGHITLYGQSAPCGCGKTGCVETEASGWRLRQLREEYFPETPMERLFTEHAGTDILQGFVRACAQPFSMMLSILDPDVMLAGGGVIEMPDFPFDRFREAISEGASNISAIHGPDIRLCRSSPEKGVLGAAWAAEARLREEP